MLTSKVRKFNDEFSIITSEGIEWEMINLHLNNPYKNLFLQGLKLIRKRLTSSRG